MNCSECGKPYPPSEAIGWRKNFCKSCLLAMEDRARAYEAKHKPYLEPEVRSKALHAEFLLNLRGLLQLCHPDKHGGSALSVKTFQWLMKVKQDLGG